jgi:peptide/nickel transport system ATP-binding protein
VIIATSLLLNPRLVIADEPSTALDVVTQASIVDLLTTKKKELGFSMIFVTHDLSLLATLSDKVTIMYAGQLAESATAEEIFRNPQHPYTQLLLKAIPDIRKWRERKLYSIPGEPPNLEDPPSGCRFRTRCPFAMPICKDSVPKPTLVGKDHVVACHLVGGKK